MTTPRREIFYNPFVTTSGEALEYVDGIRISLPTDIGIPELPDDNPSIRESGQAFYRYFNAQQEWVDDFDEAAESLAERYKDCRDELEDLQKQLWDAQAEAQLIKSKKPKKVRKEIRRHETTMKTLRLHDEVAKVAWSEAYIRYCEVAYIVYLFNVKPQGNDALALLIGELNMRSPYGPIDLETLENVALKRFRDERIEERREWWAAREEEEAAEKSEDESAYETTREETEGGKEGNGHESETEAVRAKESVETARRSRLSALLYRKNKQKLKRKHAAVE